MQVSHSAQCREPGPKGQILPQFIGINAGLAEARFATKILIEVRQQLAMHSTSIQAVRSLQRTVYVKPSLSC
jgi:hypothetical protein